MNEPKRLNGQGVEIQDAHRCVVSWHCPYCDKVNEDSFIHTPHPGCEHCANAVDWEEILSATQFDWLNAALALTDFEEETDIMGNEVTVHAVVNHRYGYKRLSSGVARELHRRLLRTILVVGRDKGPTSPPQFFGHDAPRWAADRPWVLWRGTARIQGEDVLVYGWSWDGALPRVWGRDDWDQRHGDLSAWAWLHRQDSANQEATPYQTSAYKLIRKYGLEEIVEKAS